MTDDERRNELEARARAEPNKSDGMRLLFAAGYSVNETKRVMDVGYGFAHGVAQRAGYVPPPRSRGGRRQPKAPSGDSAQTGSAHPEGLDAEYRRIAENHPGAILKTAARISLPPSVTRVFAAGTKDPLMEVLLGLPVGELPGIADDAAFAAWYEDPLARVAECVLVHNSPTLRPAVHPGYYWGHAAKVLAVYVHNVVSYTRYFTCEEVDRIEPLLYCPIDRIVLEHLHKAGVRPGVTRIREIDTREKFQELQDALQAAAVAVGVPRVWFDDVWGDRGA